MHAEYLLLRVMCVDACTCTCGGKCVIILVWIHVHVCVYSSARSCGCVTDGGDTRAAF